MATSNFKTQEGFNLIVMHPDMYEECNELNLYDEYREFLFEDFNETLDFFELDFKSGYYGGVQVYIKEKKETLKTEYQSNFTEVSACEQLVCLYDNIAERAFCEDKNYYLEELKTVFNFFIQKEKNLINNYLHKLVQEGTFIELYTIGKASNDETFYKIKE